MPDSKSDSNGRIIEAFLNSPLNRRCFDAFFRMCVSHTRGYLRYLRSRGYLLPDRNSASDDYINDLALDILGSFLHSSREQPFPVVFGYFRRAGDTTPGHATHAFLYAEFLKLLGGFVRQELARLKGQADPQLDLLKRRFREILKTDRHVKELIFRETDEHVYVGTPGGVACAPDAPVSYAELLPIVEEAYLKSLTRSEWCRTIFEKLADWKGAPRGIKRSDLLRAVIAVNSKYLDLEVFAPSYLPTPRGSLLTRICEETKEETLVWLDATVLKTFVQKSRLTSDEAVRFKLATERYLSDLAHIGQTDPIPVYFREVMPPETHHRYVEDYKYLFETTINRAVEDFRERLKKKTDKLGIS